MVNAGQVLTIDVEGQTGGWLPVDDTDLRAGVLDQLAPYFDVVSLTITRGSTLSNILDLEWFHWKYSAALTIRTRIGYRAADDVRSIVNHAFYAAGGAFATISLRSLGESQGPGVEQTGLGLGELLAGSGVLVLAVLVGLVALIAYGPNVPKIAGAIRA